MKIHGGTGPLLLVIAVVVTMVESRCTIAGDSTSERVSLPEGYFDGNHPCLTGADCPQYYGGCFNYIAKCKINSYPFSHGHSIVGECRCLDNLVFDEECFCEECELKNDELIDTGISLCFLEESSCESKNDCDEPGLGCWGVDPYGRCAPSQAGYLPCDTDDDCLFGWQCFNRPKLSMFSCYYAQGDGSDGELLDTTVWSQDNMCCAPTVCIPNGWLNVPDLFMCDGSDSIPETEKTEETEKIEETAEEGNGGSCGVAEAPSHTGALLLLVALVLIVRNRRRSAAGSQIPPSARAPSGKQQ